MKQGLFLSYKKMVYKYYYRMYIKYFLQLDNYEYGQFQSDEDFDADGNDSD
jgi:hypothetical protein